MSGSSSLAAFAALALLTGCAAAPQNAVRYDPVPGPSARLPAGLPTVFVAAEDQTRGGQLNGPVRPNMNTDWGAVMQEAVTMELERLAWPMTSTPGMAHARLLATVTTASAQWRGGFNVRVDSELKVRFVYENAGRPVWETTLTGRGMGVAGGGGVPKNGIRQAWKAALEDLMRRFGPALESGRPWERTPAGLAEVARVEAARVEAAPAPRRSDVDELPLARAKRRGHAVVIGIERYRESLPKADYASGDARIVAEYVKRVFGYPEENVAVLIDDRATRGDFEKYFERWLPNRVEQDDEVFVYYSGHGAPNPKTGDAYAVPYDADPTYIEQTGYPLKRMYAQLAKLPTKKVVVAMDSCFSGAGGRSVIAKGARPLVTVLAGEVPSSVIVLSASAGDQISNTYQEKGHGLFTYFFLKGLRENGSNLRAVYDYLKPEVAKVARREYNADQEPQWRGGRP